MALTKEEVERRWLAKRAKGKQQAEDIAVKQRKAAEDAARRKQQNDEAAVRQRRAKEEQLQRQRELQEQQLQEQALQEELQRQSALQEEKPQQHDEAIVAHKGSLPSSADLLAELDFQEAQEGAPAGTQGPAPAFFRSFGAQEDPGKDAARAADRGAVPDMEELLGSIDRMDFFDLGHVPAEQEWLPALEPPRHEVVQKPPEDVVSMEERRARLSARARARREARDEQVRQALADVQVSALARQLRPQGAPEPVSGQQQRPKAAVRMPRRMKIGADVPPEAMQVVQMPSSGLMVGGAGRALTAQAVASSTRPATSSAVPEAAAASAQRRLAPTQRRKEQGGDLQDEDVGGFGLESFVGISGGASSSSLATPVPAELPEPLEPPLPAAGVRPPARKAAEPLGPRHEEAIRGLERGAVELEDLDEDLCACLEVVLAAVRIDGHALAHASEDLRDNREVVLAAVYESGLALRHAGEWPKQDREVVLAAVLESGAALQFAARELQADMEVALTAVQNDPDAVRFAAQGLMDDRSFVLEAAQAACRTFQHASARLRQDREVVLAAVEYHADAFMHAAPELRRDRSFVLQVVRASGCSIAHAAPELRRDPEVLAAAMASDPLAAAAAQS